MTQPIVEPTGDGRALVTPPVSTPAEEDIQLYTIADVYAEFGPEQIITMFEQGYETFDDFVPQINSHAVLITSPTYDVELAWPVDRETGSITSTAGYVVSGGSILFTTTRYEADVTDYLARNIVSP